jgi:5-formyltetrahydrofolate cyclo-ligase
VPIQEVSAALVPGLGFDACGHRLGRGGGFYDRLLARLPASAVRIGVAARARVVERVPAEDWDQKIDLLVTETEVRRFGRAQD